MSDEVYVVHAVYPGGPTCNPHCPGDWSQYHEGYSDGYEAAERATRQDPDVVVIRRHLVQSSIYMAAGMAEAAHEELAVAFSRLTGESIKEAR